MVIGDFLATLDAGDIVLSALEKGWEIEIENGPVAV